MKSMNEPARPTTHWIALSAFVLATIALLYALWGQAPTLYASPPAAVVGVQVQAIAASNGAPPYLNYQGILRDQTGNLLTGQYNITFRLYDTVAGGTALWSESLSNIAVQDGRFSVLLGNTSPLSATHFSAADRFIGVQVQGYAEMIPRQRFASVPFALQAEHSRLTDEATHAQQANLANHADHATTADEANRSYGLSSWPSRAYTQSIWVNDTTGDIGISHTLWTKSFNTESANVSGEFKIRGKKPIFFRDFSGFQNAIDTGISSSEYACGIAGFSSQNGDINEKGTLNPLYIHTSNESGQWRIYADIASHYAHETWMVRLLCITWDMAEWR
jgi:hypothetical protein